ncbi:MarR family winged helix-turn-helix transcriptional regulator [Paracoccus sp. S1E-3]|uniref:MarR family winged helix-turn-helix transcriptional regulator n=1 Tax=Paracoccus sp. S1E-3 TaxID=2756130 RepID=UPI0015EF6A5E|nr:MarR family winged helix-turn-helix transcriptional regulator [Paracoccus sp. S1E-3]MBA4489296.1 winged helix-turn-helix transcriptional regulator [Paracoccus sp. S1E-3]
MTQIYNLPGHLIRRLHQIAVAVFAAQTKAAGFDLTPVQYGALSTLRDRPGIDQATLAGLIAHDRVTIGGVVSRLESRGYIERRVRDDDRRARALTLTPRGETLLQTIQPAIRATQEKIMTGLDEAERAEFMRLLHKLTETGNQLSRAPLELMDQPVRAGHR